MKKHYIYLTTCLENNKMYIGKRSCNCDIEKDRYLGSGVAVNNAIKKYGREKFKKEVLEICSSEEEAYKREKYWIEKYSAVENDKFYNIKEGGEGNTKEDAIRNWGRFTHEERKEFHKTHVGGNAPNARKAVMFSLEGTLVKEFDSLADIDRYFGKDVHSKISQRCKNKKGSIYGHLFLYKEDYEKMVADNKFDEWLEENLKFSNKVKDGRDFCANKEVYCLDPNDLKIINKYSDIQEAGEKTNTKPHYISEVCKHKFKSINGNSWILAEEYEKLSRKELEEMYFKKPKKSAKVICLTTNKVFDTIKEAAEFYNLNTSGINQVCRGKMKTSGSLSDGRRLEWKYYDDYIKENKNESLDDLIEKAKNKTTISQSKAKERER